MLRILRRGLLCVFVVMATAASVPRPVLHFEAFDADPAWESVGSRASQGHARWVTQHFGYSRTSFTGGARGEVGGTIARSLTPSMYWTAVPAATLEDVLTVSGTFSVTQAGGGSGALIGWFNSQSRGWRTPNSLALRLDGNGGVYWVFYEYGTQELGTGGGDTFDGDRYQTTTSLPEAADGTPHAWTLAYDPAGANGAGELRLTLDGVTHATALAAGHKEQGAAFDRFGLVNQQTSGDALDVYVDDLVVNGHTYDFSSDPGWEGVGADTTFLDVANRPYHDFGYSQTGHARGAGAGEIGGIVWRIEEADLEGAGYYAAEVNGLTLDTRLHARGRVAMTRAGADSAVLIGWFNSSSHVGAPPRPFLGVMVEGPSRIGHFFRPAFRNYAGVAAVARTGPVMRPSADSYEWALAYSPGYGDRLGAITVSLDAESITLELPDGGREGGSMFDRFGIVSYQRGGHHIEIWLDDLEYTVEPQR